VKGDVIMGGVLQRHPYMRTYDESQRGVKRLKTYLDMNFNMLPDEEKERINIITEALEKIIRCIPEEYQLTMHQQYGKKN
jgi:uncharacterized FlaG/YvyC family protein